MFSSQFWPQGLILDFLKVLGFVGTHCPQYNVRPASAWLGGGAAVVVVVVRRSSSSSGSGSSSQHRRRSNRSC